MFAPRLPQWEAAFRIVKYLKAYPGCGLFYGASGCSCVEAFTYLEGARGPSDRKSTTGICVFLGGILLLGRARSRQLLHGLVRSFLEEIGFCVQLPMKLYCDN